MFLEPLHGFLYRDPISEEPAQPALVDVEHAAALCFFGDRVLRLAFGAYEKNGFTGGGQVGHELRRFLEHLERLLQIDDVDSIALSEDVFLHLGIPALGLVPEVNPRFKQLLHGDISQSTPFFGIASGESVSSFEFLVSSACRDGQEGSKLETGERNCLPDFHSRPPRHMS